MRSWIRRHNQGNRRREIAGKWWARGKKKANEKGRSKYHPSPYSPPLPPATKHEQPPNDKTSSLVLLIKASITPLKTKVFNPKKKNSAIL